MATSTTDDALAVSRAEFDAALAALRDLRAENADLRRRFARLEATAAKPDEMMARLLAAIDDEWGDEPFFAEHLSAEPNIAFILRGRSCKSIGRLLARSGGKTFGGFALVDEGRVDGRRRWSVRRAV
jgi:hypothetical protein